MHSTPKTDVKLKADVLSSMLRIFAMNGQTRTVFQEVGGFVYVVSVLVSLEGSLDETPMDIWEGGKFQQFHSQDTLCPICWLAVAYCFLKFFWEGDKVRNRGDPPLRKTLRKQ